MAHIVLPKLVGINERVKWRFMSNERLVDKPQSVSQSVHWLLRTHQTTLGQMLNLGRPVYVL